MNDNQNADIISAIKSNPKAFFRYMTAIIFACSGLLVATLWNESIAATIIGWIIIIAGIALSYRPLFQMLRKYH